MESHRLVDLGLKTLVTALVAGAGLALSKKFPKVTHAQAAVSMGIALGLLMVVIGLTDLSAVLAAKSYLVRAIPSAALIAWLVVLLGAWMSIQKRFETARQDFLTFASRFDQQIGKAVSALDLQMMERPTLDAVAELIKMADGFARDGMTQTRSEMNEALAKHRLAIDKLKEYTTRIADIALELRGDSPPPTGLVASMFDPRRRFKNIQELSQELVSLRYELRTKLESEGVSIDRDPEDPNLT